MEFATMHSRRRVTRLVTADEVSEDLGISRKLVYRLAREGALPAVRLAGRSIRFDRDAVDAFIREGGAAPSGQPRASAQQ